MISKHSIMIQGTSSSAGKSCITAGFLRYFSKKGYVCSPFKPQNMSLNSFVTEDGFEIARAQAMQAEAAYKSAQRQINPILIKPSENNLMHLIVNGKFFGNMDFKEYGLRKDEFIKAAKESFEDLLNCNDIVVVEGAGSPAEINLYNVDIANMGFASIYKIPVILVADIERGGVFASIFGTIKLLPPKWRKLVKGFIINKFRGDISILSSGIKLIEEKTKTPCLGVIPYIDNLYIEAEDSLSLPEYEKFNRDNTLKIGRYNNNNSYIDKIGINAEYCKYNNNIQLKTIPLYKNDNKINIGIVALDHISNFSEFDPLFFDKRINSSFIKRPPKNFNDFDMIIIPGTKTTISDLNKIKSAGLFEFLRIYMHEYGGIVMGICGGFQMMGKLIRDPLFIESEIDYSNGLDFFDMETIISNEKTLLNVNYKLNSELKFRTEKYFEVIVNGYEIHNGKTIFSNQTESYTQIDNLFEPLSLYDFKNNFHEKGVISKDRKKIGTYVHGLFQNDVFKEIIIYILQSFNKSEKNCKIKPFNNDEQHFNYRGFKEYNYDLLAEFISRSVNLDYINDFLNL